MSLETGSPAAKKQIESKARAEGRRIAKAASRLAISGDEDPCEEDPDYCEDPPLDTPDPYDPAAGYSPQPPPLPWFTNNNFTPTPKTGMTAADVCFYTKWGVRYLSIVMRVLITSGGVLAAPEIAGPLGVMLLLLNIGTWLC